VYGTSTMKWLDCIVATTRRQLEMRGADATEIASRVSTLREQARTEGLNGRSAEFHGQLHGIDLDAAWARARTPRVLVARGEHDWVVSPAEQKRVAQITSKRAGAVADMIDLPGLDHVLGWHSSRDLSMSDYGAGSYHAALLQRTLEWMLCSEP